MLQGTEYVSLLHAKRAEIRALRWLDKATRDRLFAIVVLRPWPQANHLSLALERVDEAVGDYRYGLDLDRHKRGLPAEKPAGAEFEGLFSSENGFGNYYRLIRAKAGRIPVLRDVNGEFFAVDAQLDQIDELHRGVIVRIERAHTRGITALLRNGRLNPEDTLFVVDAGWSLDVLAQEAWASSIIAAITEWDETAEIACLSSCFPNSFSHIDYKGTFSIDDRDLHRNLVRRHNAASLTYGDWASTRASEERGGGTPYDRIDVARAGEWVSYRQSGEEVGYKVIADRVVADATWPSAPACWGRYSIECTAQGTPGGITGSELAASCRINMHLTSQAAAGGGIVDHDEPFEDNF